MRNSDIQRRKLVTLGAMAFFPWASLPAHAQKEGRGNGGTVRMMINPAGTMAIVPAVMKKFALDKKYGINVEVLAYSNPNSATVAMQGKNAEIVIIDWLATARMRAGGIPVVGIAPFMTAVNSVIIPANSSIRDLAGLRGKRLGAGNKTGFDTMIMLAAAKKIHGVNLEKEVTMQEGAVPLLRGLIENGELDATQMWNSIGPEMVASGKFKTLVTIRQLSDQLGLPTLPYLLFGIREDYARENPSNARAFVAAYQEVVDILQRDDEVWTEQFARLKLSPKAAALFKHQVRSDLLKNFKPEMANGFDEGFKLIKEVAGVDVVGMQKMPAGLITLDYQ